ncbi:MAG TPA: 16S rRNA (adenine(1518)-N(6)/adenine(1519)-N(6))-dimethyltransferase RsmA, partial [Pyrinomonadaceae bacterium]|nr:16S rRNA (adenine(1518)-N(6)/adenine(1519)-N(6))-dimethyltransferase RsmA [Pyrinomonadaceae bacterium]
MSSNNLRAKRSLGQNFLDDDAYVRRIVDRVGIMPNDTIIEIGPGRGALTERLIAAAGKVIAVELDRELAPRLSERFGDSSNLVVIEADALTLDFRGFLPENGTKLRLVANLPYNISTAILQRLIEFRDCFSDMTLMFQLEVVERITAKPGSSDRGFLTVLIEAFFESEKLFDVPPRAFWPVPKVESAVVRFLPRENAVEMLPGFRNLVSSAFAQKRKTIFNNLKNNHENIRELLEAAGIDPSRRAETLTLAEWL